MLNKLKDRYHLATNLSCFSVYLRDLGRNEYGNPVSIYLFKVNYANGVKYVQS